MVCSIRLVSPRVQRPSQGKERLRLPGEVGDVKDGGGIWDVVMLEVVVETSSRGPKVDNQDSAGAARGNIICWRGMKGSHCKEQWNYEG